MRCELLLCVLALYSVTQSLGLLLDRAVTEKRVRNGATSAAMVPSRDAGVVSRDLRQPTPSRISDPDPRLATTCTKATDGASEWAPGFLRTREDIDRGLKQPNARAMSAMVLPELRAIMIRNPKCASTFLWNFFKAGNSSIFRRATNKDGVGQRHLEGDFVLDLGETESSRTMKRDYFTFAFVCNPFHRLVSAYGTINHRGHGGGFMQNASTRTLFRLPFTKLPRIEEPQRFQTFVENLGNLESTYEDDIRFSNPTIDIHGQMWHHARTQMYYLTSSDSDITPRRLDFVGRTDNLVADLFRLLARLGVSEQDLSPEQRLLLQDSAGHDNAHEGFMGPAFEELRGKLLRSGVVSEATRQNIFRYYHQDYACLNYTIA